MIRHESVYVSDLLRCPRDIYFECLYGKKESKALEMFTLFHDALRQWYSKNMSKVKSKEKRMIMNKDGIRIIGRQDGIDEDGYTVEFKITYGEQEGPKHEYYLQGSLYAVMNKTMKFRIVHFPVATGKINIYPVDNEADVMSYSFQALERLKYISKVLSGESDIPRRDYGKCTYCDHIDKCYDVSTIDSEVKEQDVADMIDDYMRLKTEKEVIDTKLSFILENIKKTMTTGSMKVKNYQITKFTRTSKSYSELDWDLILKVMKEAGHEVKVPEKTYEIVTIRQVKQP